MNKPNLEQYFRDCQRNKIYSHTVMATDDGDKVLFYIHPQDASGETLDFEVRGNNLTQTHLSEEDDIRKIVFDIISGLPISKVKEIGNQFGLNF